LTGSVATHTEAYGLASLATGNGRRAATREQIVGAVHQMLLNGASFSELSVGRIAERAGVSRATFYLHFNDKRQLLGALAERELTEWQAVAEPLFANPAAGFDELLDSVRALTEMWDQQRAVLAALVELAEYDEVGRAAWRGAIDSVAAMITEYTRQRSDVIVDNPELSARVIAWMAERACHQLLDGASPDEREALARALSEIVWRSRKPND
jgi:AcrR family transcriptional regulator